MSLQEPPRPALLGERYLLQEVIGKGGFGNVWRARDQVLGVDRAVKVLEAAAVPRVVRERLRREARVMARIRHPHVVQAYDVGRDFLVMEWIDGVSLQDLVRRGGPLPSRWVVGWVLQVLAALTAAHSVGVIHRDVKPSNILVGRDGLARLADFGIALIRTPDIPQITLPGLGIGSYVYMSPEQRADAASVGPAADLYAVGATLFHLLTAQSPVDLNASDPSSARFHGLPEGCVRVIWQSTRFEAMDRYPDARAMARALAGCWQDEPPPVPPALLSMVGGTLGPQWRFEEATAQVLSEARASTPGESPSASDPGAFQPLDLEPEALGDLPTGLGCHGSRPAPRSIPERLRLWGRRPPR